jgi:hypothetical protein
MNDERGTMNGNEETPAFIAHRSTFIVQASLVESGGGFVRSGVV